MAIQKAEALVIRRIDFSETSQIVTLLTPNGRVDAIAKGSRAALVSPHRSRKIDGPIDTLTLNRIVYYEKRGDALDLISECEVIHSFSELRRDLQHWHAGFVVAELALSAVKPHNPDPDLFYAAARALVELCSEADFRFAMADFFARYLAALGRSPDPDLCAASGNYLDSFEAAVFSIREGRGYGAPHAPAFIAGGQVAMSPISVQVLRHLVRGIDKPLDQIRVPDPILLPIVRLLQGMIVECLDHHPLSFKFLEWTPKHRTATTSAAVPPAPAVAVTSA